MGEVCADAMVPKASPGKNNCKTSSNNTAGSDPEIECRAECETHAHCTSPCLSELSCTPWTPPPLPPGPPSTLQRPRSSAVRHPPPEPEVSSSNPMSTQRTAVLPPRTGRDAVSHRTHGDRPGSPTSPRPRLTAAEWPPLNTPFEKHTSKKKNPRSVASIRWEAPPYLGGGVAAAAAAAGGGGQLLGAADAQTAHHVTFSTVPTQQLLGSANAETTPAGAPAAAADRTQRPDATCEGKNG